MTHRTRVWYGGDVATAATGDWRRGDRGRKLFNVPRIISILKDLTTILRIIKFVRHLTTFLQLWVVVADPIPNEPHAPVSVAQQPLPHFPPSDIYIGSFLLYLSSFGPPGVAGQPSAPIGPEYL